MTFLSALLPQPLGYDSVEGRVHNPTGHSRSKLCQMFTQFSLDDNLDRVGYISHGFSAYPARSQKSSIATYLYLLWSQGRRVPLVLRSATTRTHRMTAMWVEVMAEAGDRLECFRRGKDLMDIKRVGVIGAGTMGNGIAHVFARSGYQVILCDVEQRFLERGIATIAKNLDREVAKNKITAEEKAVTLAKIEPVTDRAGLAGCDFIIEAATEKFEIKTDIFRDLDRLARPDVILASNTSSISITKLAALTNGPEHA